MEERRVLSQATQGCKDGQALVLILADGANCSFCT